MIDLPQDGPGAPGSILETEGRNGAVWIQAGPLLSSFFMFEEIESLRYLVPDTLPLVLALIGLLLTLLLELRPR